MAPKFPVAKQTICDVKIKADLQTLISFSLPTTETHNAQSINTVELAADESDRVIDLSDFCDAMTLYWIRVLTTGGVGVLAAVRRDGMDAPAADNFDAVSGDPGIKIVTWDSDELPPQVYLSNPDDTNPVVVEIGVLGNFS